jgi:hypothetical protein
MPHNLIALTGYSRSGKDTAADALVAIGYERRAFGDIIKRFVAEDQSVMFSHFRHWLLDTARTQSRISEIAYGWSLVKLCGVDPFTQDDEVKPLLRALFEDYGIWRYDEVVQQFFSSLPEKCVNSRLCRPEEAIQWRQRGGLIVEVIRPGNRPQTEVEGQWMTELHVQGLVDSIIKNNGSPSQLSKAIVAMADGTVSGMVSAASF